MSSPVKKKLGKQHPYKNSILLDWTSRCETCRRARQTIRLRIPSCLTPTPEYVRLCGCVSGVTYARGYYACIAQSVSSTKTDKNEKRVALRNIIVYRLFLPKRLNLLWNILKSISGYSQNLCFKIHLTGRFKSFGKSVWNSSNIWLSTKISLT